MSTETLLDWMRVLHPAFLVDAFQAFLQDATIWLYKHELALLLLLCARVFLPDIYRTLGTVKRAAIRVLEVLACLVIVGVLYECTPDGTGDKVRSALSYVFQRNGTVPESDLHSF